MIFKKYNLTPSHSSTHATETPRTTCPHYVPLVVPVVVVLVAVVGAARSDFKSYCRSYLSHLGLSKPNPSKAAAHCGFLLCSLVAQVSRDIGKCCLIIMGHNLHGVGREREKGREAEKYAKVFCRQSSELHAKWAPTTVTIPFPSPPRTANLQVRSFSFSVLANEARPGGHVKRCQQSIGQQMDHPNPLNIHTLAHSISSSPLSLSLCVSLLLSLNVKTWLNK